MHTPLFPQFRPRLAALGRRVQNLRPQSLCHLELLLHPFLPAGLLSQADEGPNSRDRREPRAVKRRPKAFPY